MAYPIAFLVDGDTAFERVKCPVCSQYHLIRNKTWALLFDDEELEVGELVCVTCHAEAAAVYGEEVLLELMAEADAGEYEETVRKIRQRNQGAGNRLNA